MLTKLKPNATTFVYDGDGNRVLKTEGNQTILYVNQYYEKNLSTGEVTTHYYQGRQEVAYKNNSGLRYISQDSLGSTVLTMNSSGGTVATIKYYPFGATRQQTGSLDTNELFTGQRLDGTGLYYYGARYYDATIGRFISADTIVPSLKNPQSLNRYSYCLNNPLRYVDPTGHWGWSNIKKFVKQHAKAIIIAAAVVAVVAVAIVAAPVVLPAITAAVNTVATAVTTAVTTAATVATTAAAAAATAAVGAAATAEGVISKVATSGTAALSALTGLGETAPALSESTAAFGERAAAGGGESTTALSCFRFTQAGEVFAHYSTMENAESLLSKGLKAPSYATTEFGLTASEAYTGLGLTHSVDAVFTVVPSAGTWVISHGVAAGGYLLETIFPFGSGAGSVFGPWPI